MRGCPYGGYFSPVSSTLPWAQKTGNLTIRPDSVVHSILYDEAKGKASGVRVIDAHTQAITEYRARIIFVNASALNSTLILLNSTSRRFPNGLGNDAGVLGRYVAFHNYRASAHGTLDGLEDRYFYGRNPTECILVNFRNLGKQDADFVGGYTTFTGGYRTRGVDAATRLGGTYKDAQARLHARARLSQYVNRSHTLRTHCSASCFGRQTRHDLIPRSPARCSPPPAVVTRVATRRLDIHEMGGCRMGRDPRTSMLNAWNQLHAVPNVFVTDGACMTSTGNQSPSILYMALTARAANHAVEELARQNL
jgi:choline dehydrogenase-like flavoprotein